MACNSVTLNGVSLDCGNVGGLSAVYIAPIADVSGVTLTTGDTISAITMISGKKFTKYSFKRGNANFVSTGNKNDAASTYFVETVLTVQFNKMETAKRKDMVALASVNSYVIALDNNGIYWFIGYGNFGGSGNATGNSGAQMADANQYTLTITAQTAGLPYEIDSEALATILA